MAGSLCLKRIRDDFDRGFQGQEPVLAVSGVRTAPGVSQNKSFNIPFDDRQAIWAERVPQIRCGHVTMRIKRLFCIGDAECIAQPVAQIFRHRSGATARRATRHGPALASEQAAGPKLLRLISEPVKLNTWSHVLSSHQQVTYPGMLIKTLRASFRLQVAEAVVCRRRSNSIGEVWDECIDMLTP